jgi:hypothetical protein
MAGSYMRPSAPQPNPVDVEAPGLFRNGRRRYGRCDETVTAMRTVVKPSEYYAANQVRFSVELPTRLAALALSSRRVEKPICAECAPSRSPPTY